jgi:hypothetical protein
VTNPLDETVASAVLLDIHVITRPVSTLLLASLVVAVSCTVPATAIEDDGGLTVTVATGTGVTVTDAVPLCPSLVAVIVTGPPTATPVTSPVAETVATAVLLDIHVITRPMSTLLPASFVVAVS